MTITVYPDKKREKIEKYWTKCVGSCHAATALREDWRRQLKTCKDEFGFEYIRFHGLLDDDMSVCLRNEAGGLEYSFFNIDSIFDFLLGIGMKPFIELSFMPTALASGPKTVFHYLGNITPPESYDDWADLIGALAAHLVARYGADEVRTWFFEVWNEPNLDIFWAGTMDEYFMLYQGAALAIKKVDDRLAVGGPSTAIDAWIPELREFCDMNNVPLDFISTHHYPTDAAYGLGLDMEAQMARSKRGVLHERAVKALEEAAPYPLYYSEWNSSPSPRDAYHDIPYCASFIVKTIADNDMGRLKGYSFWTFSDIFEESGFSSVPFHGGFGLLNIHGIPKPSFRAFQMLAQLGGDRVEVTSDTDDSTVDCIASRDKDGMTVILTNYQVPLAPVETALLGLEISGVGRVRSAYVERIDDAHANPKKMWLEMGSPTYLDREQVKTLMKASETLKEPVAWTEEDDGVSFAVELPPHAVTALTIQFED